MSIYTLAFLGALLCVLMTIPRNPRAQWAAMGVIVQTTFSLGLFYGTQEPWVHALLFACVGGVYVVFSVWRYGAALGICAFMIALIFVAGWGGLISIETGQGWLAPTVWNYKTILCYTQLAILWSMGRGIRNRIFDY